MCKPRLSKHKTGKDYISKINKIIPEVIKCFLQDGWLLILSANHLRVKIMKHNFLGGIKKWQEKVCVSRLIYIYFYY